MVDDVFIIGIYSTAVGRFAEQSPCDLVRTAYVGALRDAQLDGRAIGKVWFSNMMMDYWGQPYIKGHICFAPLVQDGVLAAGVPIANVEAACASGSMAVDGAWKDILAGQTDLALAIGVEKMYDPQRRRGIFASLQKSIGQLEQMKGTGYYQRTACAYGAKFQPASDRALTMDIYALLAKTHMAQYGTTARQMACAAAKNHTNSVENPRAQYQFPMNVDAVLADRMVCEPLTRAMCAPIGDGAAAAILCSAPFLRGLQNEVRNRAVRIRAIAVASGRSNGSWEDDRSPVLAARRAYKIAGLTPSDIDVVELHDATAFAELHLIEDLGLCPRGHGGPVTASGGTARDSEIPVNMSGGLVSRGHPVGATGIMMLNELCFQLRGEAGALQIPSPRIALSENSGGIIGNDYAACAVTILEASG